MSGPIVSPVPPSAPPLRVALIGFGLAGACFHAPFIAVTPGLRLTRIVTSNPTRAAQARHEYPDAIVCARASEVWDRPGDIDLVVIAAPNAAHVPLATAAIQAGIPVVVDKPLAVSASAGRQLVARARQRGVMLTVFQNRREDGDFLTVRRLLAEGSLGQLLRFESRFERWRPQPKPGWRESASPEDGGGLLIDLGSHLVDQAVQLFGPVASVYAELDVRRAGVEVEDDAFVALSHTSGVRSHLWMSVLASQPAPRFRLIGSAGSYVKFGLDVQEDALRAGERPGGSDWGEDPEDRWGLMGAGSDLRPMRTERGDYGRFYVAVERAVRTSTRGPVDPEESLYVLEILEAAKHASAERRVIEMPGPAPGA